MTDFIQGKILEQRTYIKIELIGLFLDVVVPMRIYLQNLMHKISFLLPLKLVFINLAKLGHLDNS